jgi:predicted CxxxxCH...CXXCH cytochrome family protein
VVVVAFLAACSDARDLSAPCTTCEARVHPDGILDPSSPAFHGAELARRNWGFATCATCHGTDFRGGTSGVSCVQCHTDGPTACTTCHANGPTSGAHVQHRSAQLACAECHRVPDRWDAPGHIVDDAAPAEVVFGPRAALTPDGAQRTGPPTFESGTCRNVYCHGATMDHAGGDATEPHWDQPAPTGTCTHCHASPPPSHARRDCATCHPADAPHIDGVLQIGTSTGCSGCHGDGSSPAPPRDLAGNTSITSLGVGAHRAHLDSPSGLRGPVACTECHAVPATVTSPGHIDSELPAEVTPTLGWERASATCTSAWCHGPSRPVWTRTGDVACGTCHGIPPSTPSHTPAMTLASCATCHPQTVTAAGGIIVQGGQSAHMNGVVDAQ